MRTQMPKSEVLERLANFAEYKHEPRIVEPKGLIEDTSLILKMYAMVRQVPVDKYVLRNAKKFLRESIRKNKIGDNPILSGLGFAILSDDMLNLAVWDSKHPIVLKNSLYEYAGGFRTPNSLDIRHEGCFCIWELGIVAHERDAWKKYLASERTEQDKRAYLKNFFRGELR